MLRSLFALLMILLADPACAGNRFGGFHGGGFPAFRPSGGLVFGLFGGYFCGYNCGFGFYNPGYGYFNSDGYGYDNGSFSGYGYFNRYGYLHGYGYGYGSGAGNAVSISNGLVGGYIPDPVGADIPPLIIPKNCWVRRAAYDPSGAQFGQVLVNLCRTLDRMTVTGSRAPPKTPETGIGTGQPLPQRRSGSPQTPP